MRLLRLFVALSLPVVVVGCGDDPGTVGLGEPFTLVFEDQFDGAEDDLPDLATWAFDIGLSGGEDVQFYTGRAENVSTDGNGNLRIVAREESFGTADYTSARIRTEGNLEPFYGRIEARIQVPSGLGLTTSFELVRGDRNDVPEGDPPRVGRIDAMAYRDSNLDEQCGPGTRACVLGAATGPRADADGTVGTYDLPQTFLLPEGDFPDDFHDFAVEWDPGRIAYFVDGQLYHTVAGPAVVLGEAQELGSQARWVFNRPHFIVLGLSVGHSTLDGGTQILPPDDALPATVLIDYVRVYERNRR